MREEGKFVVEELRCERERGREGAVQQRSCSGTNTSKFAAATATTVKHDSEITQST